MTDVRVVLRDPLNTTSEVEYIIHVYEHELGHDWLQALKENLASGRHLNKDYLFVGFPETPRNLDYLCGVLNRAAFAINTFDWQQHGLTPYVIEDYFTPDVVRFGPEYQAPDEMYPEMLYYSAKHTVLNRLHNHFERLQGTVENPSHYFLIAPPHIRKAMGQLNTVCHEIENLVLSQRKAILLPEWIRPSQITSWHDAPRYQLKASHRELFRVNGYDRRFGHVYLHWAQIGKTLFEVFRDEDAPKLDKTTCEAITHLQYYSGEFDVEWGRDVVNGSFYWHDEQMANFWHWLRNNDYDPEDSQLSLGYLPLGYVKLQESFGTTDPESIWKILSQHLDIIRIEVDGVSQTYDYSWRDTDV